MRTLTTTFLFGLVVGWAVAGLSLDERPEKAVGARSDIPGALVFVDEPHALFDDVYQFETVERVFVVRNDGSEAVVVEDAISVQGRASVAVDPSVIPAGEILIDAAGMPGLVGGGDGG